MPRTRIHQIESTRATVQMKRSAIYLLSLAVLLGAVAAGLASQRPAPDRLRADIAEILAGPEYHQPELTWLRELRQRVEEWLRRFFQGWSPTIYRLQEAWPILYWAIVVMLCALLALFVYHIILTFSIAFRSRSRPRRTETVRRSDPPEALRARAARLAEQGKYAEAIHLLFEALLGLLDRRDILRFDRSRTNWEFVEAVRSVAPLRREMEPLAVRLDGVLYGGAAADASEYNLCAGMVERAWAAGEAAE